MLMLALATPPSALIAAGAAQRVLGGGIGALAGLVLLTGGILAGLARSRWPGR